jgi:hypothetical protein
MNIDEAPHFDGHINGENDDQWFLGFFSPLSDTITGVTGGPVLALIAAKVSVKQKQPDRHRVSADSFTCKFLRQPCPLWTTRKRMLSLLEGPA